MLVKAVLIISGKGGVGKSVVCANLAVALKNFGYKVGVLDTDISNPNIPQLLKIENGTIDVQISGDSGIRRMVPHKTVSGMQVFSTGLITADKPISFSGAQTAELLRDVITYGEWNVDVFAVDLPAGLGDELKASVKVMADMLVGSVIVVSPAHLDEAERVIKLHLLNGIPIVGLIENMAYLPCPHAGCADQYFIYGKPGAEDLAKKYGLEYLGEIPILLNLRENAILSGDLARPIEFAAQRVLDLKPQRPGFLQQVVEKGKEISMGLALDIITTMYKTMVKEVDIKRLQTEFNYPGGNIIRLNLYDELWEKLLATMDFMISAGKLKYVSEQEMAGKLPDIRLDVKMRALAWAFCGYKKVGGREIPYQFEDAWFNDDIRVFGDNQSIRAIQFVVATWTEMKKATPDAIAKLAKVFA